MNDSASVPLRAKSAAIKAAIDPARLNVQTMGQEKFTAWPMPTQDRDGKLTCITTSSPILILRLSKRCVLWD